MMNGVLQQGLLRAARSIESRAPKILCSCFGEWSDVCVRLSIKDSVCGADTDVSNLDGGVMGGEFSEIFSFV
ncbi:hypothetical protein CEXT_110981 [Caerostris extrusa]|uniref:Uncharacterized protein n=1 Tax=Caerostris extrusa TaxID=172846 RepID=A0AAV4X7G0_CAEEX|nr:hypothetical protein CEXT_110981 [Caerostris extrusa]